MTYTETLTAAGVAAGVALVALWERWADPEDDTVPDEATFLALGTALLVAHRARGVGLADTALAAVLSADTGRAVPTLGLALPAQVERFTREGLDELVPEVRPVDLEYVPQGPAKRAAQETAREAVQIEGKAQTVRAAQEAYGQGMRQRRVPAWRRVLNAGACELCVSLAKDELPGNARMYIHRGCTCTQRPILNQEES